MKATATILGIGVAALAFAQAASAVCARYSIQVIQKGCSFANAATAWGLSSDDRVCGYYSCGASVNERPFVWKDGVLTNIPLLPNAHSGRALDVNSLGQVTGSMELNTNHLHGFIYQNGQTKDLGILTPPPGDWTEGYAINGLSQIVGYSAVAAGSANHGFFWQAGNIVDLNLPLGPNGAANDIDDQGKICGWMGVDPVPSFGSHAFLWTAGAVVDLGVPPGCATGNAVALNNKGEVVVNGGASGTTVDRRSYLWRNGVWTDLGIFPGFTRCFAFSINDHSEIVGYCTSASASKAFLWRDGIMTALDDLVPQGSNLNIRHARGINNNGMIAATGSQISPSGPEYALLLTPTPGMPGDVNCDDHVNIDDLVAVITHWGPAGGGTIADLNSDGTVDINDLTLVLFNWG